MSEVPEATTRKHQDQELQQSKDSSERGGDKHDKEFEVKVIYNGTERKVEVRLEEVIKQVLDRAVHIFSPLPQPHTLSLFTEAGKELNDNETVQQAGIRPMDRLLLRPGQVKGG